MHRGNLPRCFFLHEHFYHIVYSLTGDTAWQKSKR